MWKEEREKLRTNPRIWFFYWVGEIVAITEIMKMGKEFDGENSELNIR